MDDTFKLKHYPSGSSEFIDHPSQAKPGIHPFPDKLYVVTMLENPLRARSRYNNYWAFEKHVADAGALLYTCEVALGGRKFEITEPNNLRHLQLRTESELWRKENALNLMVQRLPVECKYIAWIDADVIFARPDWAQETLHQLQHFDVIQMFSQVHNLGPDFNVLTDRGSFMWNFITNRNQPHHDDFMGNAHMNISPSYYGAGDRWKWLHTGFAWAARKSAWDVLGGLIDWSILGSADYIMACALTGNVGRAVNNAFPKRFTEMCYEWAKRANVVRNNPEGGVGYMAGAILHHFHGSTKNRAYEHRHRALIRCGFNPDQDLKRDFQGLWQLTDRNVELRDVLRAYNRLRNEDSDSVEGMI